MKYGTVVLELSTGAAFRIISHAGPSWSLDDLVFDAYSHEPHLWKAFLPTPLLLYLPSIKRYVLMRDVCCIYSDAFAVIEFKHGPT